MNKSGQVISIVTFFAIVLGIFIVGVLIMSFAQTILNPVQTQLGNVSAQAGTSVGAVKNVFAKWWDVFVIVLFFLNVLILLISSFMIDIHPLFLLVYIIAAIFLVIFGGNVVGSMSDIWSSGGSFANGVAYMPLTQWMLDHFTLVILAIIIISGVVMYAKFKIGNGGGAY